MAEQKKKSSKSPLRFASRTLRGQIISSDFFTRNWLLILVAITLIMVYITNKYKCQTAMEEITKLEEDLSIVETEYVRERSEYMSKITELGMQERLDSLHLDLKVREVPPFVLK